MHMNRLIPSFLISVLGMTQILGAAEARAAEAASLPESEQVIQPEIDRRDIRIPQIDTEDYEVGAYAGILSIEDFGARMVYGGRLAYHVNEDFFIEGVYGMSTITDEAFCNNGLCLLPNRVEDLTYFAVSVGYNLTGFDDRDFRSAVQDGYTTRGAYLRLRVKFDDDIFRRE